MRVARLLQGIGRAEEVLLRELPQLVAADLERMTDRSETIHLNEKRAIR